MTNELNSFLDEEGTPTDADPPVETFAGDPPAAPPAADPAKPTDAPAPVVEEPPEEIPEDVRGLRTALQEERTKRRDHKGRADRLDGELAATKAALEEARKAPQATAAAPVAAPAPVAQAAPIPIPNPAEDPAGYQQHIQRMLFNERLNISEAQLREAHDDADVDAKMAVFKKAAEANPALRAELNRQVNPYKWAYAQAVRIMAMDEIGTDPAAYRAKIEAEIRAKVEAELAAPAAGDPTASIPAIHLPRSLANATNAGARATAMETVPEFEDVFKRPKRT